MHFPMCFKTRCGYLYVVCTIANLTSFLVGYLFAWTSTAIPRMDATIEPEHNPLNVKILSDHKVWITTLLPIGAVVGASLSGYLVDKRGRKEVQVVATLFATIGCAIVYFAQYVSYILIGRIVAGLGVGGILTVTPLYLGEIANDQNRGLLGIFMGTFIILGMLVTYVLTSFVTLINLNLIFFVTSFVFLLAIDWWIPESPYWLLSQGRENEAENSLRRIRGCCNEDMANELIVMKKYVNSSYHDKIEVTDILKRKDILKALCISCGLAIFQQILGVSLILFYLHPNLGRTKGNFPKEMSTIIISILQVLTCTLAAIFVDKLGRRRLLLISTVGSGLSLIALGAYFYLKDIDDIVKTLYWLPIVSTVCFIVTYSVGLGPVPFVILGEIFFHQIKATASAVTICVGLIFTICTTTAFTPLSNAIGLGPTFWILAATCFINGLFLYCYIPETNRRSLQDIQEILKK